MQELLENGSVAVMCEVWRMQWFIAVSIKAQNGPILRDIHEGRSPRQP